MFKVIQGNFSVAVSRDGRSKVVQKDVPFDFTQEEIDDIISVHGDDSLRDPVDETAAVKVAQAAKPAAVKVAQAAKPAATKATAAKAGKEADQTAKVAKDGEQTGDL